MIRHWPRNGKGITFTLLLLFMAFIVACGAAATPTPTSAPAQAATLAPEATATPAFAPVPGAKATQAPAPSAAAKGTRLRMAIAGTDNETNRFWGGTRQDYIQYDPMMESLIGTDPETGLPRPRLATSWEASPDLKSWTFTLRKDVPFHRGPNGEDLGTVTAKDVIHTFEMIRQADSNLSTWRFLGFPRDKDINEVVQVIDDHTFVWNHPRVTPVDMVSFLWGRLSIEMAVTSKDYWDQAGLDGLDRKLIGTGSYEYKERRLGQSIIMEKAPQPHWSGENPDFDELEIFWVREDATRFAALLAAEAHIADLELDLRRDAERQGMKLIRSRFRANDYAIYFGGLFLNPDDPRAVEKLNCEITAWCDIRVRQAMNMAVNRQELLDELYGTANGEFMLVEGYHPTLDGWDDSWTQRFDAIYGYNLGRARELLAEAGYGPTNPVKVNAMSYVSPNEAEHPTTMEAICGYWKEVNIDCSIEPLDGGTVSKRRRGMATTGMVWPNIIIAFPTAYWAPINNITGAPHGSYSDKVLDGLWSEWKDEPDPARRTGLARQFGEHKFSQISSVPLFWFSSEIVVNPSVVDDWIFPGNAIPRTSHFANIKATQ